MAILYTQGEWVNEDLATQNERDNVFYHTQVFCGKLRTAVVTGVGEKQSQANAALICDAVNNTVGKGIDPNAVAGLLRALKEVRRICNLDKLPEASQVIDKAIKSAELK